VSLYSDLAYMLPNFTLNRIRVIGNLNLKPQVQEVIHHVLKASPRWQGIREARKGITDTLSKSNKKRRRKEESGLGTSRQGQASTTSPTPARSTSMSRAALSPGHPEREGGRWGGNRSTASSTFRASSNQEFREVANRSCMGWIELVRLSPHPFFPLPCFSPFPFVLSLQPFFCF